jgi:hypothetical protein
LIKNLTEKKVRKALKVETNMNGMGNFLRVRVKLDVRKVLGTKGGNSTKFNMRKFPDYVVHAGTWVTHTWSVVPGA